MYKFSYTIFIYVLLIFCSTAGHAQQNARIVLQNDPTARGVVNVKWYSQQFVYGEGSNVYRREEGAGWTRLNTLPIKQWKEMPQVFLDKDSNLIMFTEVMKAIKPEELNGLMLLQVMTESFLNPNFSRFVGIQYDDATVTPGKKYEYRITYYHGITERELAISEPIVAGNYEPLDSLSGFFTEAAKMRIQIGWKAEDTRFFGTNLYRADGTGPEMRLNKNPIALSMKRDSVGKMSYPRFKYVDDSVLEKHHYRYRITGLDFFGNETRSTVSREAYVRDMDPPSAPVEVRKKIQKLNVWLSWKNTETKDLMGFNVYRSTDDKTGFLRQNKELITPGTPLFLDEVPYTGGYYYFVSAVDSSGNEGRSDKLFADVADLFPPKAPTGLKAVADTGLIRLTWHANAEPDLQGYMIYRTIDGDNLKKFALMNANALKDTFFTDRLPKNLKNRMVYRIAAMDTSLNRSELSKPASVRMPDVLPPAQPFIRNVEERDRNLVIEWIPNVEPDLKGYIVMRSTDIVAHPFEPVSEGILSRRAARFTDHSVTPDTLYYYSLVAVDSSDNHSVRSHWFSGTVASRVTDEKSSEIVSFKAQVKKERVRLQWKTRNVDSFLGYALFREANGMINKITEITTDMNFTDPAPVPGARYQLRLYHGNGVVVKSVWITTNQ